jgi:ribosome-associated toxin RatA of RatAB toxin-antitoxin module
MSDYEHSTTVNTEPAKVFAFISDVRNLPKYLPTVQSANSQGQDRVRVRGEAGGHSYDSDGYFRANQESMRMEWGSDGENRYSGWIQVEGPIENSASKITVHLSFEPRPQTKNRLEEQTGDQHATVQQGLEDALKSIKRLCEGSGGKVQSAA